MGVKSTVTLTRQQAIAKYVAMRMQAIDLERKLEAEAASFDDQYLEIILERVNDFVHGGEGFENYLIRQD